MSSWFQNLLSIKDARFWRKRSFETSSSSAVGYAALISGIIVVELLALAPLMVSPQRAVPDGYSPHQLFPVGADIFVYENYLRQAAEGIFAMRDRMTAEPQALGITNPFWFTLGFLGALLKLTPEVIFQVARLFFLPLLVSTVFILASQVFQRLDERLLATGVVCGASGLGFLTLFFLPALPPDFLHQNGTLFNHIFSSPHVIFGTILIASVQALIYFYSEHRQLRQLFSAVILGVLLLWFQPYFWPMIALSALIWHLLGRPRWRSGDHLNQALFQGALFLPVFYHALTIIFDPFTAARYAANITLSPSVLKVFGSFSILMALAFIGFRARYATNNFWRYLLVWLISGGGLMFLPVPTNYRFIQGLMIPLGLAASAGLLVLIKRAAENTRFFTRAVLPAAFVLLFFGSVVSAAAVISFATDNMTLPSSFRGIIQALEQEPAGVILSDPNVALVLVGRTWHRAYAAHWSETLALSEKLSRVDRLFFPVAPQTTLLLELQALGINYVVTFPGSQMELRELETVVSAKTVLDYGLYRVPKKKFSLIMFDRR